MYWNKYTHDEMKRIVFNALKDNSAYDSTEILGLPGTYLDRETFYDDAPFLKDAPFLSTLIANPNHIGCHTLTEQEHEDVFKGTQKIEVDLIRLCAEQIFKGDFNEQDGYVASGGTEANIQAIWIYRNYFIKEKHAFIDDIAVVYSEDSHYSMAKAANLLHLNSIVLKVDESTRMIKMSDLHEKIEAARMNGVKYFIIVMNLSTTMFGSVDDIRAVTDYFNDLNITFKLHIDAAFGGFIYPFTNSENDFNFQNLNVTSITIDGHKMLQSPYGTGIFLIRKGYMEYVCTDEAQYVPGKDYTLSGSRSGANAVSVWMILRTYGSDGWKMKMEQLTDKTSRLCSKLSDMNVTFFRNPYLNIIAIRSNYISNALAKKYHLVADTYEHTAQWYKIVIMPHVKQGTLDAFVNDLQSELNLNQKLCI